jgi:hypothetical protein
MIELILGFIIGWIVSIAYLTTVVHDTVEKLRALDKNKELKKVPVYYIEVYNTTLYVWDEKDKFVTQCSDIDSVISTLKEDNNVNKAVLVTDTEMLFIAEGNIFSKRPRVKQNV